VSVFHSDFEQSVDGPWMIIACWRYIQLYNVFSDVTLIEV